MRNYRIAFFTADWNYELVESTLHGLKKFVEDHPNVNLCIFDCFGKDQDTPRDKSEYGVFDLADLSRFDGLLIQGNQIVLNRVREKIASCIAETGIPAVTIDCPLDGCTLIGIDNRKAQYDLVDHLIRFHGVKKMVYLTGLLENGCPEGKQRRDGFLDACRENNLPPEEMEVIPCTWRTDDGCTVAKRWLKEKLPFPDAFVCGNDEMAIGMMEVLKESGVRIPEDVIVTGFDDLNSAELSNPRLSTVCRDNEMLDYRAMELLLAKIDQTDERQRVLFSHRIICSESCGCHEIARPDYLRDRYYQQIRFLKDFYTLEDELAEELFDASDLPELMEIVERKQHLFGCDKVYLCINDYYFDNYDKNQWPCCSESFGKEMVLFYPEEDRPSAAASPFVRFPAADLLPDFLTQKEKFLVFYPLHYNTYSIGYLAMNSISEAAKLNLHESIFSFLEIAIENVRKKCLLRQLNSVLDDLYVHDALTGLYNRFGFGRCAQSIFDAFLTEDGGVQILFADMDDLKEINDMHGHEIGDDAIRCTARLIKDTCGTDDFIMRYGGDEFLVIASGKETGLPEKISHAVRDFNVHSGLPFELNLSIGSICSEISSPRKMDECIQAADTQMYRNKKRKKGATA